MAFKHRKDGIYLATLPAFRRIFPYLMQTRTESLVYFTEKIEMTNVLRYLARVNEGKERGERISLFHIILAATVRILKLRPELNRFIAGRRIYEHKDISISFVVKKELAEEAEETNARIVFKGTETLREIQETVGRHLGFARSPEKGDDDRLLDLVAALPRPFINLIASLIRFLDYHNVLPQFLMKAIPLYTSVYLANLGSIGLDERITEGFYCAKSIELFKKLIENPMLLENDDFSIEKINSYNSGI